MNGAIANGNTNLALLMHGRERGAGVHEKRITARYFLLSFAIGFLVLSVTAMLAVLFVPPEIGARGSGMQDYALNSAYLPSVDDAINILLIVDSGSVPGKQETFLLIRFDPLHGQIPVTALPAGTLVGEAGDMTPLGGLYDYAGANHVKKCIAGGLGVAVDRFIKIDQPGVVRMVDLLGGVPFRLKEPVDLTEGPVQSIVPAGMQELSGSLFGSLICHTGYRGGEAGRAVEVGALVTALINEHMDVVLTEEADSLFEQLVNIAQTDISIVDYQKRKSSARFMAKLLGDPAFTVTISGNGNEAFGAFALSENTRTQLSQIYSPTKSSGAV